MIAMEPAMWKYMVESGFAEKYGLIKKRRVMKLNDLALRLSEKEGISCYKATKVINSMFDIITDAVSKGEDVYLRRLGKISLRQHHWRRVWRTGNKLFHRKESQEGYSLLPHIKLSKRFKREVTKK